MHQGLNIRGKEFNYKKPKAVALGFSFIKLFFYSIEKLSMNLVVKSPSRNLAFFINF